MAECTPLSTLCPLDEVIPSEYLIGRRYYEYMISLNGGYSIFPCRKAFRLTYPMICKRLAKVHTNYLLFPEISDAGRFHYHVCIEYIPAQSVLYSDFKNWAHTTIGHTDGYTIDEGTHKATKPTDVAPCRCLFCRLTYMYKQQKLMKTVLRFQCPVNDIIYNNMKTLVNERKQEHIARTNRRNLAKANKYIL